MAVTIRWKDNSLLEKGHRIYKSSTYFTPDNLPAPLVDLSPDIEEYEDTAGNAGENWYIVSAYILDYEVFSEPFIPGLTTIFTHDIFGDGSAVATYNFDGDATDLGGNYDGSWVNGESYNTGIVAQSAEFTGGNHISLPTQVIVTGDTQRSISLWSFVSSSDTSRQSLVNIGNGFNSENFDIEANAFDGSGESTKYGIHIWAGAVNFPVNTIYDEWVHLVVVHSGGDLSPDNTTMYVNNTPYQADRTRSINTNNNDINLGYRDYHSDNLYLTGRIDQLRFFNRALTQSEVDILYQEGAS